MNRRNKRKIDGEKVFSIVASLAIIAALVVGVVSIVKSTTSTQKQNYIDLNVADDGTNTAAPTTIDRQAQKETEKPTSRTERQTQRETKPTQEQQTEPITEPTTDPIKNEIPAGAQQEPTAAEVNAPILNFGENSNLLWPVEGNIVIGYNMDNTIYFPTLDLYKCSPSIVISAAVGTPVLSAAPGIVEDIYVDSVTGTTMIVSIGDGYKLTYGQLGNLAVGISDTVEAGTELGRIAEPTKYFTVEGSNLYFGLTREGAPVDPMLHLAEKE